METWSFTGHIAGLGTSRGLRVVVGLWDESPFGPVADAMVEDASGHRTLIAPTPALGDFIAATYTFDNIVIEPIQRVGWAISSPSLRVSFVPGRRAPVGWPLRAIPRRVRDAQRWARVIDPIARRVMPGVRTFGTAGSSRTEWYAARDAWQITDAEIVWSGANQGPLAPVDPPVHFGFGSAPRRPTLTALTSFVQVST